MMILFPPVTLRPHEKPDKRYLKGNTMRQLVYTSILFERSKFHITTTNSTNVMRVQKSTTSIHITEMIHVLIFYYLLFYDVHIILPLERACISIRTFPGHAHTYIADNYRRSNEYHASVYRRTNGFYI